MSRWHDHANVQADLYQKRRAARYHTAWAEIEMPGTKGGRFDVFACRTHDGNGTERFIGYEVKATAADLESDLASGKWRKYLPACDELWFALGPHLSDVDIDRIPAEAGVMVLAGDPPSRWQRKRKAPTHQRTVDAIDIWRRIALREHWAERPRTTRTRLERMQEYAEMQSLRWLVNGKVMAEITKLEGEARANLAKTAGIDRKKQDLERLQAQLEDIPDLLGFVAEALRFASHRIAPGRLVDYEKAELVRKQIAEILETT